MAPPTVIPSSPDSSWLSLLSAVNWGGEGEGEGGTLLGFCPSVWVLTPSSPVPAPPDDSSPVSASFSSPLSSCSLRWTAMCMCMLSSSGGVYMGVKDRERVLRASLRQSQWRALSRYHNQYTPVISITHIKSSSGFIQEHDLNSRGSNTRNTPEKRNIDSK